MKDKAVIWCQVKSPFSYRGTDYNIGDVFYRNPNNPHHNNILKKSLIEQRKDSGYKFFCSKGSMKFNNNNYRLGDEIKSDGISQSMSDIYVRRCCIAKIFKETPIEDVQRFFNIYKEQIAQEPVQEVALEQELEPEQEYAKEQQQEQDELPTIEQLMSMTNKQVAVNVLDISFHDLKVLLNELGINDCIPALGFVHTKKMKQDHAEAILRYLQKDLNEKG